MVGMELQKAHDRLNPLTLHAGRVTSRAYRTDLERTSSRMESFHRLRSDMEPKEKREKCKSKQSKHGHRLGKAPTRNTNSTWILGFSPDNNIVRTLCKSFTYQCSAIIFS